ncbi:unnamed protein product [Alternaria alternata]
MPSNILKHCTKELEKYINPQQTPLPDPQHRTPIYQIKKSKDLLAADQNRPSASLRSLFNEIKRKSTTVQDVRYTLAHLEQNFNEEDQNIAVVLSRSENDEIFVLNEDERLEVDDLPSTPFYIGPLEGYAIIELLSQPVFFFRTRDSLRQLASSRVVARKELNRRDRNGNVAMENIAVRWRPVAALSSGKGSGSEGNAGDTEGTEAAESIASTEDQEGEGNLEDMGDCFYVRARLSSHRSVRYAELIPRVLAAVNQRQSDGTGFSYQLQGRDFGPGRTLLVPLDIDGNYILLAAQYQPDRQINLTVLDPMTWRTTLSIRTSIFQRAKELLLNSKWCQDMFDPSNHMIDNLPGDAEWIPTAQITTSDGSFIYTVLNAWALAMGLELNPSFTPSLYSYESFFIQAQQIFDLALQGELTWKVLLAFCRCAKFVKSVDVNGADGEVKFPERLRQFDLRKCSFQDLITRQTVSDTKSEGKIDMESTTFGFEHGKRHRQKFASDSLSERERCDLDSIVREGKWTFTNTVEELRTLLIERAPPAAPLPLPQNPYVDTEPVADEFDCCLHLRTELQKLVEEEKIMKGVETGLEEATIPTLMPSEVYDSIEAVGRAINDILPPGHGFTMGEVNGVIRHSDGKSSGCLDDVVLMLHQKEGEEEHFTLVVLQHENKADYPSAVARVLDSAPWTFTSKERIQLHELLQDSGRLEVGTHRGTTQTRTIVGSVLTWMHGPQQSRAEESGYFAIMNSWAVLLGLPINNDFCPREGFFQETFSLIQAVKNGNADWKLIWAFLLCAGYIHSTQLPPLERRFRTTRKSTSYERRKIDEERTLRATGARHNINYDQFPVDTGLAHTETFPWDDFGEADRSTRISEMIKAGKFTKFLSPQIEHAVQKLPHKDKESPCAQFHGRLNEILENEEIKTQLKAFRDYKNLTTVFGQWLEDEELSLAIASVTIAITNAQQDYLRGFGFIAQTHVELIKNNVPGAMRTPRPGRPLLVPVHVEEHFVLLVIQLDDKNEPEFSVLDSKAYHITPDGRTEIHEWAWKFVLESMWLEKVFPSSQWQNHKPAHTTWVPVSQQPSDCECGYYTIMNGWTLALGLTPNPNANIEWTDRFYGDLQDVIHLARIGRADWSLIYRFLVCYGFVLSGEVSADRRFTHTTALLDEGSVEEAREYIIHLEDIHFAGMDTGMMDINKLRHANRIRLSPGRQHDSVGAFPSDDWSPDACMDYANDLARNGRLNLDFNKTQLEEAHANLCDVRGLAFRKQLEKDDADYKKQNPQQLRKVCQDYLNQWHTSKNLLLQLRPCSILHDTLHLYRYIFREDFLGNILKGEESGTGHWNQPRNDSDVSLAIASVIAAIDDLQLQRHKDTNPLAAFAGGFCLSTSYSIALAGDQVGMPVSRPRRCWFMPLGVFRGGYLDMVDKWRKKNKRPASDTTVNGQGHHILVILQELEQDENSNRKRFEISIYDSAPSILADATKRADGPLSRIIKNIAGELKWPQQRLNDEAEYFIQTIPASSQQSGGWQCGSHVVINAWILALGLHPDPSKAYDDIIYEEFHTLARAAVVGLLDWRTLAAWIFCRQLAFEKRVSDITPDRQFRMTDFWRNENSLSDKIRENEQNEITVAAMSEADLPYDRGNNPVHWTNAVLKKRKAKTEVNNKKKDKKHGLWRSYDDPDPDFLGHPKYTTQKLGGESQIRHGYGGRGQAATINSKKRKPGEKAGYCGEFTRDTQLDCDMEVVDSAPPTPLRKRQRLGDVLSFFDTY